MRRTAFGATLGVAVLSLLVALSYTPTTHVTTTAAPHSTVYVPDDWTNPTPTTVVAVAEPEPEAPPPELCPGAPHPEQACLAPAHNHEATSPSAGTRQASSGTSAGNTSGVSTECESGSNYGYNDGTYYGAYNFDAGTWRAAGGSTATADQASRAEQDAVAASWVASGHRDAWPNC